MLPLKKNQNSKKIIFTAIELFITNHFFSKNKYVDSQLIRSVDNSITYNREFIVLGCKISTTLRKKSNLSLSAKNIQNCKTLYFIWLTLAFSTFRLLSKPEFIFRNSSQFPLNYLRLLVSEIQFIQYEILKTSNQNSEVIIISYRTFVLYNRPKMIKKKIINTSITI